MRPPLIEQKLSPLEQEELYQRCRAEAGGFTGPVIAKIALEFGLALHSSSANHVRNLFRARHEADLREHAQSARTVVRATQYGLGLSDAAASKLSAKINDALDQPDQLSLEEKEKYSLAISRLRTGDQRHQMLEIAQSRLELHQFDASAAAIEHATEIHAIIADKTLDDRQKTERVRKILFGEKPADLQLVTAEGRTA